MSVLYMLVGLPGSGKSTFRRALMAELTPEAFVFSSDDTIDAIASERGQTYSEAFAGIDHKAIEGDLFAGLDRAVAAGHPIVVDRTNMTAKSRRRILSKVPPTYDRRAEVFILPPEVLQERIDRRAAETGKVIPPFVVATMRKAYECPSIEEGFSQVVIHETGTIAA